MRVSGTLTDQRFGFDQRDVFFSVLRMIASPILVPIEWFTLGPQPRDGADVCTDPLRAGSPLKRPLPDRPRYCLTISDSTTMSST